MTEGRFAPAEYVAAHRKMRSDESPKMAMPSSAKPKIKIPWRGKREDKRPPAILPRPKPSMKALTTTATDSAFTP